MIVLLTGKLRCVCVCVGGFLLCHVTFHNTRAVLISPDDRKTSTAGSGGGAPEEEEF